MSWDEERIGRLLGERARRRGLAPLPEGASERMLAAVRAEHARGRRWRGAGWATGLAALLLASLMLLDARGPAYGEARFEVALLNAAGRELDTALRGAPEDFVPPVEVLVEVVPEAPGLLRVVTCAPDGALGPPSGELVLVPGEALTLRQTSDAFEPLPRGDSRVAFLLLGSVGSIPEGRLRALLPERLEAAQGVERTAALDRLARALERELGCSTVVRELVVARRAP